MTLQVKGYLFWPSLLTALLLLLLLLPSLVVSRNLEQRPVNEAAVASPPSLDLIPPLEKPGLMIGSWPLIARPEKRRALDYSGVKRRQRRSSIAVRIPRAGAETVFPAALVQHQQSTNAAAATRDLHYKQQQAKRTRAVGNSKMIVGEENSDIHVIRRYGHFLPGQINSLTSNEDYEDTNDTAIAFLPPKILYEGEPFPEPFVSPLHRERGYIFGLANFLIRDRPPMEPRKFSFQHDESIQHPENADETSSTEISTKNTDSSPINLTQSATMSANSIRRDANLLYALYYQVLDEELKELETTTVQSLDENSLVDDEQEHDEPVLTSITEKFKYDHDGDSDQDYGSSEVQSGKLLDNVEHDMKKDVKDDVFTKDNISLLSVKDATQFFQDNVMSDVKTNVINSFNDTVKVGKDSIVEYIKDNVKEDVKIDHAGVVKLNHKSNANVDFMDNVKSSVKDSFNLRTNNTNDVKNNNKGTAESDKYSVQDVEFDVNNNVKKIEKNVKIGVIEDIKNNLKVNDNIDSKDNIKIGNSVVNIQNKMKKNIKNNITNNFQIDGNDDRKGRQNADVTDIVGTEKGEEEKESLYEFDYRVIDHASGNDFGHYENRRGRETNGRYYVLLPNGQVQRVVYTVDRRGYRAAVTFEEHKKKKEAEPKQR